MVSTQGIFKSLLLVSLLAFSTLAAAATSPEAVSLYNQACDASLAGQTTQAITLFRQAMQAGFDDLRHAETDPDLSNLTTSPEFKNLLIDHQNRLALLSSQRGFELQNQQWTPWAKMESPAGGIEQPATVRLKWQPLGLEFEIRLSGDLASAFDGTTAPPASGGPSIIFTMTVPDETSSFESTNAFHFLFGKNKASGTGALYLGMGWQPVNELTPEFISQDRGQLVLVSGTIPWQTILPYHPLVDSILGLNIAVQSKAEGPQRQVLFPDPHVFSPGSGIHRFAPMNFDLNTVSNEAMVGRLSQSVVSDEPLQCDLKVISAETGTGHLTMDFLDDQGNSVLAGGAQPAAQSLSAGINDLSQSADFRALNLGPYLVKIELEMPSGSTLSWSSLVLNTGPDWKTNFEQRISKLATQDQPTADFYLETVETAIKQLPTRGHPGSLTTTLLELNSFVDAGITSGSILPNSGVFILVWKDARDQNRFCSLYLPVGHRKSSSLEPVVLWADAPGTERRLATRIGKFAEYPRKSSVPPSDSDTRSTIYLVPHPPAQPFANLSEEVTDLHAFLTWVDEYFKMEKTALAGVSAGAGAVLEFSLVHPEMLSRILVYSGARLEPWPQANAQFLSKKFEPKPENYPPMTWIDFATETQSAGQGKLLLSVLDAAGYIVEPAEQVKGGLSLTQITDRLVLWAE